MRSILVATRTTRRMVVCLQTGTWHYPVNSLQEPWTSLQLISAPTRWAGMLRYRATLAHRQPGIRPALLAGKTPLGGCHQSLVKRTGTTPRVDWPAHSLNRSTVIRPTLAVGSRATPQRRLSRTARCSTNSKACKATPTHPRPIWPMVTLQDFRPLCTAGHLPRRQARKMARRQTCNSRATTRAEMHPPRVPIVQLKRLRSGVETLRVSPSAMPAVFS